MNSNTSSDEDDQQISSQEIEQVKEYIKNLYRIKNCDFWKYSTTGFKSGVNMTPKVQIRDVLAESVPNQPIKSTIKYDEELFSESELNCMASGTNRLVLLENARTEFDSILEYTAKEGKPQRGLDYVIRKTAGKSQSNVSLFDLIINYKGFSELLNILLFFIIVVYIILNNGKLYRFYNKNFILKIYGELYLKYLKQLFILLYGFFLNI